jgi:hypothetical protein
VCNGFLAKHPGGTVVEIGTGLNSRFPGALIVLDTYSQRTLEQQHRLAAGKHMDARWAWSCDDPHTLESLGLEVVQQTAVTRPPRELHSRLPHRHRYALPLANRIVGDLATVTLFRASSH